jgi:pimeloyl-ACP methyl ester carboxylesterase
MTRRSEIVTAGQVPIETYADGDGPGVVVLPPYGRDGGDDFDPFLAALAGAGYRVLRPQPRVIARSTGTMTGVTLGDFAPGHDASIWLTGWYPQTLQMQHAAVTAAASRGPIGRYRAAAAPVFEIIAAYDPFHPRDQWGDLRSQPGSRVTTTVIDGASHALFPGQPDAVASAVIGYLQTLT